VRSLLAILLATMLILPIHASAASSKLWDDARLGMNAGTMGGPSILLSNNTTNEKSTIEVSDLPSIVEVYTATWCFNCVKTEIALDEAIGSHEVLRFHYHRYLYETLDPFGSESSDSRWIEEYGRGSLESSETPYLSGTERAAPSKVFDGERMYTGDSTRSNSLVTDYSTALSLGSSHPFQGNGTMSMEIAKSENGAVVNWYNDLSSSRDWTAEAVLMIVEDSIYYPNGTNGLDYYHHVLHETIQLPNWNNGSLQVALPPPWDGDDISLILLIDWETTIPAQAGSLPAPAVSTLLCLLAALTPRRKKINTH
jgi:hypothetical protein